MTIYNENRKGYYKTKLGWIPEDWDYALIKDCLIIENNNRTPINKEERKLIKGNFPYYGPTKIQDYINCYKYDGTYALIAEDGDHFLKYRDLSMTQLVSGKFNVNNHAHIIKGTKRCSTEWFYWYYNRKCIYSHITRQGAGRYKLNKASLQQLPITIPPLKEQKKIAEILSTWDKAIEHTQTLVDKLKVRKKGLIQQLLTGKTRLPGFSEEWRIVKLSEILLEPKKNAITKPNLIELLTVKLYCTGIEASGKFPNKTINGRPYYIRNSGEMLIGRQNFHNGGFGILPNRLNGLIASNAILSITAKEDCDLIYISYAFSNPDFYKKVGHIIGGTGQKEISSKSFFKLTIYIPSLFEQKAIAKILTEADKEIKQQQDYLDELKNQKRGMMQQLLTGQKRVTIN